MVDFAHRLWKKISHDCRCEKASDRFGGKVPGIKKDLGAKEENKQGHNGTAQILGERGRN